MASANTLPSCYFSGRTLKKKRRAKRPRDNEVLSPQKKKKRGIKKKSYTKGGKNDNGKIKAVISDRDKN